MYCVEVDFAPAYELTLSLLAYLNRPDHRLMDLGSRWAKSVEKELTPAFAADLADRSLLKGGNPVGLLIWRCPGPRDANGFLRGLSTLSSGNLYELLAPWTIEPLPRDLISFRDRYVALFEEWNEQYFRHVDLAIIAGLEADADKKRVLVGTMEPVELVELATNGLRFTPPDSIERVLLIPQYHHRPWNSYAFYRGLRVYQYPAGMIATETGEPSSGLMRVARALTDESRLRILKHVGKEQRTFTELVTLTGLAKSTVHHHMVALRAAGLVRVHDTGEKVVSYSLRPDADERLSAELRAYLIEQ